MDNLEKEVSEALASDPHYPLGEHDAMKWAVAFKLICQRSALSREAIMDPGFMVGWFANAMASEEMRLTGGSFLNADGMQSIIDGEMQAHSELHR